MPMAFMEVELSPIGLSGAKPSLAVTARPEGPAHIRTVCLTAASRSCRWIDDREQIGVPAHDLGQAAPGADFIVPALTSRRAADADHADHLVAVDHNGQPAALSEIAKRPLPQLGTAACHGVRGGAARLARLQRGSGLEKRRLDPLLALTVHAIEINRLAELIENGDAHSH